MFRLFIFRLASGKIHLADTNHIHHLIQKNLTLSKPLLIQFLIILNLFLFYYIDNKIID